MRCALIDLNSGQIQIASCAVAPFGLPGHQSLEAGYATGRFSRSRRMTTLFSQGYLRSDGRARGWQHAALINFSSSTPTTRPRVGGFLRTSASLTRRRTRCTGS